MAIDNLEAPPKNVLGWGNHWVNWIYKLYRYVLDVASQDYWIRHAINVIAATYGDKVSVDAKNKDLIKFGRTTMDTSTDKQTVEVKPVSTQDNETYVSDNLINRIVSSSTGDIAANNRSAVKLEGHTIDGNGNFTFVSQDVALNGQTAVTLSTPLARVTRLYNNDSSEIQGKISIYESAVTTITSGVPTAGYTGVHLTVRAGEQNSEKCSTTISNGDYFIVTGVYADVLSKTDENIDLIFEVREKGKTFREYFQFTCSTGIGTFRASPPYAIVPKNSDVRIRAKYDGVGSVIVAAGMFGTLAKVV